MGLGPNFEVNLSMLASGSTAYTKGELLVVAGTTGTLYLSSARATSAAADVVGVADETLDVTKVLTGKAVSGVVVEGITRVLSGAAITARSKLTNDTTARAVAVTRAIAGAQPAPVFGIALTPATAAGQYIDVLLTPGATF